MMRSAMRSPSEKYGPSTGAVPGVATGATERAGVPSQRERRGEKRATTTRTNRTMATSESVTRFIDAGVRSWKLEVRMALNVAPRRPDGSTKVSDFSLLTSYFLLLTSYFLLLTS